MREANEMELPEEQYRVAAEKKRKELTDLMAKFSEMNNEARVSRSDETKQTGDNIPNVSGDHPRYERPSERRKRLEKQSNRYRKYSGENFQNDAYSSFGGRQNYNN